MPYEGSNPTINKICCNIHLFCVPRSWTGSFQQKSSLTFIRGTRCIEKEKDHFKNGGEVKRLNECTLALNFTRFTYLWILQLTYYQTRPYTKSREIFIENL